LAAIPGVVRVGAQLGWHTAGWAVRTSGRASVRLAKAATSAQSAADLADDIQQGVRRAARDLIDVTDLEDRIRDTTYAPSGVAKAVASVVPTASVSPSGGSITVKGLRGRRRRDSRDADGDGDVLHARGEALLRLSRDVRFEEEGHPAYDRILSELAPDEARILMLLLTMGPQPAVDVRTGGPLGVLGSKLLAPGLSMIGPRAGLRYTKRVPAYLNNLHRLGLVWFSRETLQSNGRYQVLEAQPDVLAAIHSVRAAKIVRRSIHLTPFGEEFCRACLPLPRHGLEQLPHHGKPPEEKKVARPPAPA
jgi:hypothetical protein